MIPPFIAVSLSPVCDSQGNPVPDIKWLKDGHLLVPDWRHQVLSHGRFLQISGAQVADTGRYSCLASNSAGDRSRHFNLNVLGMNQKNRFVTFEFNMKLILNETEMNVGLVELTLRHMYLPSFCFQFLPPLLDQALTVLLRR